MLSTMVHDQLYRDVFCHPSSFPTSRFRQWLQIYSVDLEITDPDGRRLSEATFPGCGCDEHHGLAMTHGGLVTDRQLPVTHGAPVNASYEDNLHPSADVYCGQSEPDAIPVPIPEPVVVDVPRTYEPCGHGGSSQGGTGSARRRGGRRPSGRGRARGAKRKSTGLAHSESNAQPQQHYTSDVVSAGCRSQQSSEQLSSTVDTTQCCHDDSAVVEFLASLQSDAAKRRQQEQQLSTAHRFNTRDPNTRDPLNPRDVDPRECSEVKVVDGDEAFENELHVDESSSASNDHDQSDHELSDQQTCAQ